MIYMDFFRPTDWGYMPGRTAVVVGPAYGGIPRTPIEVTANPYAVFGGGPLAEALDIGLKLAPEMRWVGIRLNGQVARAVIPPLPDIEGNLLVFESISGTDQYNEEEIILQDDGYGGIELLIPSSGGHEVYKLSEYTYLAPAIEAINRDALHGRIPFWVYTSNTDLPTYRLREALGTYQISGGSSELEITRDELFLRLHEVLQLIDGKAMDALILAGLYFDDRHEQGVYGSAEYGQAVYGSDTDYLTLIDSKTGLPVSYHSLLAEWCSRQLMMGRLVVGFIGCRPLTDPSLLLTIQDEYARMLVEHVEFRTRLGLVDRYGQDTGKFLHIVCGEGVYEGENVALTVPAAVAYLRSGIDNSTNAPIGMPLRWELDAPQREALAQHGVITFYHDMEEIGRIWSGVTAAPAESDWHWSINVRQVQLVVAACLDQLDHYVGADFRSVYLSRGIDRDIKQLLDAFRSSNVVSEYTFSVEYIPLNKTVRVEINLAPKHGLEMMRTVGQVTMG